MTGPPCSSRDVAPPLEALPHKPCRSGQTGMRPFGSLGPRIDVAGYGGQLEQKVAAVKGALAGAIPGPTLDAAAVFPSPPTGHRHRAGPLVVLPASPSDGSSLELAMWDPVARAHSIVRAPEVPIYSAAIAAAMEALRRLPIRLDAELERPAEDGSEAGVEDPGEVSAEAERWGHVVGRGLRSVQLHSTLSGDLLVCLVYHDERLRCLRQGERLPGEGDDDERSWRAAAQELRRALQAAVAEAGSVGGDVDVVGRWKRRRLVVERDYVVERFSLADGRIWLYRQPEGQFSNPNAPVEVSCLDWLCGEAAAVRRSCEQRPLRLLELYCGGGCNTLALAPYFDEVVAVEINRVLAAACEANLSENGVRNVRLVRASSASAQETAVDAACPSATQVVLVDPPRAGLDEATRELVQRFEHVLYISCNPDALAGDLVALAATHEAASFALFDMFPYTTHAECAVRLVRRAR